MFFLLSVTPVQWRHVLVEGHGVEAAADWAGRRTEAMSMLQRTVRANEESLSRHTRLRSCGRRLATNA